MREEMKVSCILGMLLGLVLSGACGCLLVMRSCIAQAPIEYEALVRTTAVYGTLFGLTCIAGTMLAGAIVYVLNDRY